MKQHIVIFTVGFAIAIIGLTSYFLYIAKDSSTDESRADATSSQVAQNQTGLQVQGDSTQPQLPTPEQFGQYEQYATSQSPLIIDIREGNGAEVKPGDTVSMVYSGYLTNGQIFDQSRVNEQNQIEAFTFTVGSGQVIQGWEQGIPGMKVGGQRRLIIPSTFGYGPAGQGSIPPNSMLIFDVELVQIGDGQQQ